MAPNTTLTISRKPGEPPFVAELTEPIPGTLHLDVCVRKLHIFRARIEVTDSEVIGVLTTLEAADLTPRVTLNVVGVDEWVKFFDVELPMQIQ